LIDDRLQYLSGQQRAKLLPGDDKFLVPMTSIIALEMISTCYDGCEIIFITRNLENTSSSSPSIRMFPWPSNKNEVEAMNFGIMLSRSRYVLFGDIKDSFDLSKEVSFLEENRSVPITGSPDGFLARRRIFEMTNGLDEKLDLEKSMYDFWEKFNGSLKGSTT
jgi:hypothetical protein